MILVPFDNSSHWLALVHLHSAALCTFVDLELAARRSETTPPLQAVAAQHSTIDSLYLSGSATRYCPCTNGLSPYGSSGLLGGGYLGLVHVLSDGRHDLDETRRRLRMGHSTRHGGSTRMLRPSSSTHQTHFSWWPRWYVWLTTWTNDGWSALGDGVLLLLGRPSSRGPLPATTE
jgi:hypothetical protein